MRCIAQIGTTLDGRQTVRRAHVCSSWAEAFRALCRSVRLDAGQKFVLEIGELTLRDHAKYDWLRIVRVPEKADALAVMHDPAQPSEPKPDPTKNFRFRISK